MSRSNFWIQFSTSVSTWNFLWKTKIPKKYYSTRIMHFFNWTITFSNWLFTSISSAEPSPLEIYLAYLSALLKTIEPNYQYTQINLSFALFPGAHVLGMHCAVGYLRHDTCKLQYSIACMPTKNYTLVPVITCCEINLVEKNLGPSLTDFIKLFQRNEPLVHILYDNSVNSFAAWC